MQLGKKSLGIENKFCGFTAESVFFLLVLLYIIENMSCVGKVLVFIAFVEA